MRGNSSNTDGPDFSRGFVRSGDLITVTIGRNLNTGELEPMGPETWAEFVRETSTRLGRLVVAGEAVFGPFYGQGSWVDEKTGATVTEESATVTLIAGYSVAVAHVESTLGTLARQYDQDAIAWAHGPARLQTATPA